MPSNNSSRTRNRDRANRYSPAPSKPQSPTAPPTPDSATRVIPEATIDLTDVPFGRYNYQNFPPEPDVWRADDMRAIAAVVARTNSIAPAVFDLDRPRRSQARARNERDVDVDDDDGEDGDDGHERDVAASGLRRRRGGVETFEKDGDDGDTGDDRNSADGRAPSADGGDDTPRGSETPRTSGSVRSRGTDGDKKTGAVNDATEDASGDSPRKQSSGEKSNNSDRDRDGNARNRHKSGHTDAMDIDKPGGDDDDGDKKDKVDNGSKGSKSASKQTTRVSDDVSQDNDADDDEAAMERSDDDGDARDEDDESSDTIPSQLSRKSTEDIRDVLEHVRSAFDSSEIPFAPRCTPANLIASLASEVSFLDTHAHERNLALQSLVKSRRERKGAETSKAELMKECKQLTAQIEKERERRGAAAERRAQLEKLRDEERKRLEKERERVDSLRVRLEDTKMNDLEMRRRLDRMRLKVGALRGEMVVPTVDQLCTAEMRRLGEEFDERERSRVEEEDDGSSVPAYAMLGLEDVARRRQACMMAGSDDATSSSSFVSNEGGLGDLDMDADEEAMEYRLLKNRLEMVEMEAAEWRDSLMAERKAHVQVLRSKVQLEEELVKLRQGGGAKHLAGVGAGGGPGGSGGVGGGSGRGIAKAEKSALSKLRTTVRASITDFTDGQAKSAIRKGRKSKKPTRSLSKAI